MDSKFDRIRKTYWVVLTNIIKRLDLSPVNKAKNALHKELKVIFGIGSTSSGKEEDYKAILKCINVLLMFFAREKGIYIVGPNEPDNAEDLTLGELLKIKENEGN